MSHGLDMLFEQWCILYARAFGLSRSMTRAEIGKRSTRYVDGHAIKDPDAYEALIALERDARRIAIESKENCHKA